MKNKKSLVIIISAVSVLSLVGCKNNNDATNVINSISIVENSIKTSYSVGDTVSYTNLAINTLNSKNEIISTLKASEHATEISYTNIDTSSVTDGKTFTVTYTSNETSFTASLTYTVKEVTYQLSNWSSNVTYTNSTSAIANPKLSTSEDSPEAGFIQVSEYYIGNNNSVDLIPTMTAINPNNPLDTKKVDTIPSNVEVTLKDKDNNTLNLDDYLENTTLLKTKGIVKFKETVTGKYTLTFTSPEQQKNPIVYSMNVVDAYNVNETKDIFALDSSNKIYYTANSEKMKQWKLDNNIPYADSLVFQKDITVNKSDLPSFYIWGDDATNADVKGSYKDWQGLIEYRFKEEGTAYIYGNNHRLALNDSKTDENAFPLITTESDTGEKQKANTPISTHASIFYTDIADPALDPEKCKLSISNLEFSGNAGVKKDSDDYTSGPMFIKAKPTTSLNNVNVSKAFMAFMSDNWSGQEIHNITTDITNCRFKDLEHAAIYIKNGLVNITNSDIATCGGPLIFLNPHSENLPTYTDPTSFAEAVKNMAYTNIAIDDKTFLSNYTEGKGGWFKAYTGAEAYSSNIKTLDTVFQAQLGMTYLKSTSNGDKKVDKFNFISFVLPTSSGDGLSLDTTAGGINASFKIGDKVIYSTLGGINDVYTKAIAYSTATDEATKQAAALAYVEALTNCDFGNNLTFAAQNNAITFKALNDDNTSSYGLVNVDTTSGNFYIENTKYRVLASLGYDDATINYLGISKYVGDSFKKEGYLTANINSVSLAGGPLDITNFKGACNYGLILGGYHTVK